MKLSEIKHNYIFTTKIELDEENWVELREPSQSEIVKMSSDNSKNLEVLGELFPVCVVGSSFTTEDGKPAKGNEIYNELKNSGSIMTEILTTWLESVPFQHRLKKHVKSN